MLAMRFLPQIRKFAYKAQEVTCQSYAATEHFIFGDEMMTVVTKAARFYYCSCPREPRTTELETITNLKSMPC